MNDDARPRSRTADLAWLGAAGLVTLSCFAAAIFWPSAEPARPRPTEPPGSPTVAARKRPTTPRPPTRPDLESPHLNARPGVKYVGDSTCKACHSEIVEKFARHPMGRAVPDLSETPRGYDGKPAEFAFDNLSYRVERNAGRLTHAEIKKDSAGKEVVRVEAEPKHVIGSGEHGHSYLVERNGSLFQSPIAWYSDESKWGLAPTYERNNLHFERPISAGCLFCHTDRVSPDTDAINRFQPPILKSRGIGCERCHGPGELHAKLSEIERQDGPDPTIVNPGRLSPALRDAVCEQCHLQGEHRILRAGRDVFDFRPGLPLHEYWSVFIKENPAIGDNPVVGHVEQTRESACFKGSNGKLGCISCHDPHESPAPETKDAFYRNRCLTCHMNRGCAVSEPERRRRDPRDRCAACHMPKRGASNVAHTARTPHTVIRDPDRPPVVARRPVDRLSDSLIHFHDGLLKDAERVSVERDRGIALTRAGRSRAGSPGGTRLGRSALPLLEYALESWPNDPPANLALAESLRFHGRFDEALAAYQTTLEKAPRWESALERAAVFSSETGRLDLAVDFARRAAAINPARSEHPQSLAQASARKQDWKAAGDACRAALAINPFLIEVRELLIHCELKNGRVGEARAQLEILRAFAPPNIDSIERRFASPKS